MMKNWLLRASCAFFLAAVVAGTTSQLTTAADSAAPAAPAVTSAGPADGEQPVEVEPDPNNPWG